MRRYLRYSCNYRDLVEMMAEPGLSIDHSTIVSLGSAVCSDSERAHAAPSSPPEPVWRVDETYVRVAGTWTYLYRALDSEGNTVDFMVFPYCDRVAAKYFLQLALRRVGRLRPRVINVDGDPAYPSVIAELKRTGEVSNVCRCQPSPYMNNIIEQDHCFIQRRIAATQ